MGDEALPRFPVPRLHRSRSVEIDAAGSKIKALEGEEWTSAFFIFLYFRSVPATTISTLCDPHCSGRTTDNLPCKIDDLRFFATPAEKRMRGDNLDHKRPCKR